MTRIRRVLTDSGSSGIVLTSADNIVVAMPRVAPLVDKPPAVIVSRLMNTKILISISALALAASAVCVVGKTTQEPKPFPPPKHEPAVVTPGKTPGDPPSDALVLFDGKDLSK